jgi:signal transduction histidine kinase
MSSRWIRFGCWGLVAAVFGLDLATPQLFVVAILLNAPIALSNLAFDRRFTQVLIVGALLANAVAGYANAASDRHWDAIAIGDRLIAALSFLLVGLLSIATQRSAQRAGVLAARAAREARQRRLRGAIDAIRASSNAELIARAIVREAPTAMGADAAWLFLTDPGLASFVTYALRGAGEDVIASNKRPEGAIVSLLERVVRDRRSLLVSGADPVGRLFLDRFEAERAIATAIEDRSTFYGILVLVRARGEFDQPLDEELRSFVQQAAIALGQAALFGMLAERNDQLAAANAALVERGDVIRDIVYALSHDLRTPLSAASMTMRQAIDGAYGPLPEPYLEIVRRTLAANDELQRLAETLLLVSRYESGDRSRHRERVSLARLATEVIEELAPLWKGKGLYVTTQERTANLEVEADSSELRRAVVNLIANAVAFTPPGGSIEVATETRGDLAEVVVSDSGHGVPATERERLFARVRTGAARPGAGSGLGLYLVRRVAENHAGTVAYEPRAGGGSVFRLQLPRALRGVT